MITPADLWPPFGLVVTAGDLQLSTITDDDLPGLVELALEGLHAADAMPFDTPWTLSPPDQLPREFAQFHWKMRAESTPAKLNVMFAVRRAGELVGVQGFHTGDYAVTRTAETGSWLAHRAQGHGVGTRMRQAVCALLFDHLDATEITSGAFLDNPASLGVSRKVGYQDNGTHRHNRQGALATHQFLKLDPQTFVRGEPVQVSGHEPLRRYLGLS
jgi:RimJ/RimL family protein N-acetyltransferase